MIKAKERDAVHSGLRQDHVIGALAMRQRRFACNLTLLHVLRTMFNIRPFDRPGIAPLGKYVEMRMRYSTSIDEMGRYMGI